MIDPAITKIEMPMPAHGTGKTISLEEAGRPEDDYVPTPPDFIPPDFMECDICRNKPGTPDLCHPCLNNRTLIYHLRSQVEDVQYSLERYRYTLSALVITILLICATAAWNWK